MQSLPVESPEVSIIVPLYNEEENVPILAAEIAEALEGTGLDYEVLWVDDGSDDGSPRALAELTRRDPRARVLRIRRNSGLSAGLAAGFRHARAPRLVTLDADLQNDPADIPRLLALLDDCDVVCGVRQKRRDRWLRRAASRVANRVRNRLTRESIEDVGCTLRAYRAAYVARVPMFRGMHRFLPTLLKLAGARVLETPIHHRPRLHGEAKYNIRNRIGRAFVDLFAVRWMQARWIDPDLVEEIEEIEVVEEVPRTATSDDAREPAREPAEREEARWTSTTRTSGSRSALPASSSSSAASSSSG